MRPALLTQAERAVVALFRVTNGGWDETALARGLHECDLAVRLWQDDPLSFGMVGYREAHPDRKTVCVLLAQKCGPIKKGWVERHAPGRVRLTPVGLELGRRLTERRASA